MEKTWTSSLSSELSVDRLNLIIYYFIDFKDNKYKLFFKETKNGFMFKFQEETYIYKLSKESS